MTSLNTAGQLVDDLVEAEREPSSWQIRSQPVVFLLSHVA